MGRRSPVDMHRSIGIVHAMAWLPHAVGAHQSGRIGEDPSGIPNNLFPIVSQVAVACVTTST